jgi:Fic family protein
MSAQKQPNLNAPCRDTHPFISFVLRTETIPVTLWTLLGECSSKLEHVLGTPLRKDVADEFSQVYLAKGIHATTAIEGNTLSEAQVKRRLQGELDLPPSQAYLGNEIDNILEAYNQLIKDLRDGVPFTIAPTNLATLNGLVLKDLKLDPDVVPGKLRLHDVGVFDYKAPPALHIADMLARMCDWLNDESWTRPFGAKFVAPILRAILYHLYIAWIHPFGDGNGRTARLVEFDILVRAGVPPISAHLLSDHYNRTRGSYYKALSSAREDPVNFISYAVSGLLDMLREQLKLIRTQQTEVTWIDYIHTVFQQHPSTTARRQREVALALGGVKEPVILEKIPLLTPTLAKMYAARTLKTVRRDVAVLRKMRLVTTGPKGASANLDIIRAFMPHAAEAKPIVPDNTKPAA